MVTRLWNPLRRWWEMGFQASAPAIATLPSGRLTVRSTRNGALSPALPVTPFRVAASGSRNAQRAARRFWMTLDPQDRCRGAIGGSFAEVCAALEGLAAVEDRLQS